MPHQIGDDEHDQHVQHGLPAEGMASRSTLRARVQKPSSTSGMVVNLAFVPLWPYRHINQIIRARLIC